MKRGVTVWFTGLPCSGKTTIADRVYKILESKGYEVERLDGDIVRQHLSRDLGFTAEDRRKNLERVSFVASLLTKHGVITLCTFVSPYNSVRKMIREIIGENFLLVYVKCPLEVCIERDVKGMYKKALRGEIKNFTGIDDPFEEPENPDLVVETDKEEVEESVRKVLKLLVDKGYVGEEVLQEVCR